MQRRSFILGLVGALAAAPALALPLVDRAPAAPSAGEPQVEPAKWGRGGGGRGWGRGGNPHPRGRARRVRRGWYRPRRRW